MSLIYEHWQLLISVHAENSYQMLTRVNCSHVQALQAQLLQRLAASGGTASLAHISQLPQQTVIANSGLAQSVQPCVNISVVPQQQQAAPSSDKDASVQQQAANGNQCLSASVSWHDSTSGPSSQSNHQIPTESCQKCDAGVSQLTSSNILQSSHLVPGCSDAVHPAHINQLQQYGQSTCTEQNNSSQSLSSPTQLQSSSHSRVIEQLQQQLLQSSAKQSVNGCALTTTRDSRTAKAVCKGEEGEVNSNELMQFLS